MGRQDRHAVHLPPHPIYEEKQPADRRPVEQQIEQYLAKHGSASVAELETQLNLTAQRVEQALGDFPDLFVSFKSAKSSADSKRRLWKLT